MLVFYINTRFTYSRRYIQRLPLRVILAVAMVLTGYVLTYIITRLLFVNEFCSLGELNHIQRNVILWSVFMVAVSLTYFFATDWYQTEIQRKQLESLQVRTELNFLKSQINPHFLFNTLNNLFAIAQQSQAEELANGIARLADMMRYMIYECNAERVPLEKEVDYLRNFIALTQWRYTEQEVQVDWHIPTSLSGQMIAPMLLIPFIENAFKYGVQIGMQSTIRIALERTTDRIRFTCQNPVFPTTASLTENQGIGLENVKRRLSLLYPGKHELEIRQDEQFYSVTLLLFQS